MVDSKDVIAYDAESHACSIDGVLLLHRASYGKKLHVRPQRYGKSGKNLKRAAFADPQGGGIFVVNEGQYVRRSWFILIKLLLLKKSILFRVLADDAHGPARANRLRRTRTFRRSGRH
jgi:glycine C-acetyltransferase